MRFLLYTIVKKFKTDLWGNLIFRKYHSGSVRKFLRTYHFNTMQPNLRKRRFSGLLGASGFKAILLTRNKMKAYYGGLTNKEYRSLFSQANRMEGNLTLNLVSVFELQLYVVVYRMNLAPSIREARIRVKKGFYAVNKQVILNPRVVVQEGDVVEVVLSRVPAIAFEVRQAIEFRTLFLSYPKYFEVSYATLQGIVLYQPNFAEVPYPFHVNSSFFIEESLQQFR